MIECNDLARLVERVRDADGVCLNSKLDQRAAKAGTGPRCETTGLLVSSARRPSLRIVATSGTSHGETAQLGSAASMLGEQSGTPQGTPCNVATPRCDATCFGQRHCVDQTLQVIVHTARASMCATADRDSPSTAMRAYLPDDSSPTVRARTSVIVDVVQQIKCRLPAHVQQYGDVAHVVD